MASTLRYDTATMRDKATAYEKTAQKMLDTKQNLNDSINILVSSDWISDAGEAFQETYSSDWGDNVDKYVAVLNEFAKMLRKAANEYDAVTRTAEKISLD